MAQKRILLGSVGERGDNRPADVALVSELINGIPVNQGGPDGNVGASQPANGPNPDLIAAIDKFQKKHFGWSKGRLGRESATLYKLYQLSSAGDGGHASITVIPGGKRQEVIDEARKWIGKVGDHGATKERRGWDILQKIFDETMLGGMNWQGPKKKYHSEAADADYMVTPMEGLKTPGMRIPQDDEGRGLNWCGIFATWSWRNKGIDVKWKKGTGGGPTLAGAAKPIPTSTNFRALMPGDICAIPKGTHHFLIVSVSSDFKSVGSVDGNTLWQEIEEFKEGSPHSHKVADLTNFYSLDSMADASIVYSKF